MDEPLIYTCTLGLCRRRSNVIPFSILWPEWQTCISAKRVRARWYTVVHDDVDGPGTFPHEYLYLNLQVSRPLTLIETPPSRQRSETALRFDLVLGNHEFGTNLHKPRSSVESCQK